jgi:hypothetical protein
MVLSRPQTSRNPLNLAQTAPYFHNCAGSSVLECIFVQVDEKIKRN